MPLPQEKNDLTYADYLAWPEEGRWEIIDGLAYMQAAPSPVHQAILTSLLVTFHHYLSDKDCKIYPGPFCVRLTEVDEDKDQSVKNVVEPDLVIVCDKTRIDARGYRGAPDLIIEIVSPSSIKMDKLLKFNRYEKAGVREYWIVEPEGKLVSVFVLGEQKYGRPEIYTEDDTICVTIFPDLQIDLKPIFAV